jgi:hypothetical protein
MIKTTTYTKADEKPFIVDILDDDGTVLETVHVIAPDHTFASFDASKITKFPYKIMAPRAA